MEERSVAGIEKGWRLPPLTSSKSGLSTFFSIKGQIRTTWGFAGQVGSAATLQVCCHWAPAAIYKKMDVTMCQ